jgi:DNA polymerase III subunit epsilon
MSITRQIVLDTETTGLDPSKGHRITEIGCIEMVNRRETGNRFHTYLNPERDIDEAAQRITGLTRSFLEDKPTFSEVAKDLLAFLKVEGTELIIHNAPFDLGFLNWEFKLLDQKHIDLEQSLSIFDTLVLARRLYPGQRNNLDAVCRRYNIDNTDRDYHGALIDAKLLMRVYLAMTAGQSTMSFADTPVVSEQRASAGDAILSGHTAAAPSVRDFPLRIIRASQEELDAHLKRLAAIRAKKERA